MFSRSQAEEEVAVREKQLDMAKENFNEDDFADAQAQEEAVDKELSEVKEKVEKEEDKVQWGA